MSGRHQPTNGADSPDVVYNRYRVLVEEEAGGRVWIDIPNAMGTHDANHQAVEKARDMGLYDVTTLVTELHPDDVPVEATFEEWTRWAGLAQ